MHVRVSLFLLFFSYQLYGMNENSGQQSPKVRIYSPNEIQFLKAALDDRMILQELGNSEEFKGRIRRQLGNWLALTGAQTPEDTKESNELLAEFGVYQLEMPLHYISSDTACVGHTSHIYSAKAHRESLKYKLRFKFAQHLKTLLERGEKER